MPLVSKVNKKCLPIKIKGFLKPDFFIHSTSKKLGITVPFFHPLLSIYALIKIMEKRISIQYCNFSLSLDCFTVQRVFMNSELDMAICKSLKYIEFII